jgi:hypothetical protein
MATISTSSRATAAIRKIVSATQRSQRPASKIVTPNRQAATIGTAAMRP